MLPVLDFVIITGSAMSKLYFSISNIDKKIVDPTEYKNFRRRKLRSKTGTGHTHLHWDGFLDIPFSNVADLF